MKNLLTNSFIAMITVFILLAISCNKDNNCRSIYEGIVLDEVSEELLDSVKITISEVDIDNIINLQSSSVPNVFRANTGYSNKGEFEFEFDCDEKQRYLVVYSSADHYPYREFFTFARPGYFSEIKLCPASFLELDLENRYRSDRVVYTFEGYQCDNLEKTIGYYTPRNFTTDTTELIKLPISTNLSINLKSFREDTLQVDTTVQFEILEANITKIKLNY